MKFPRLLLLSGVLLYSGGIYGRTTVRADSTIRRDSLKALVITADRIRRSNALYRIGEPDLRVTVSPTGEADVIKYIQTLPGISTGAESSSAIYVRGGNAGNNRLSIDGIPLYGTSHLLGFTSVFSPDMIGSMEFAPGGFRAEEGNLLSSHIRLTSREGDFRNIRAKFSASNFLLGGTVSVPLLRDKISLSAGGRYSPIAGEYKLVEKLLSKRLDLPDRFEAAVYDLHGKLTYRISPRQQISALFFKSRDRYRYVRREKSDDRMQWDNTLANLSWRFEPGERWELKANASYNEFSSGQMQERRINGGVASATRMEVGSLIREKQIGTSARYRCGEQFLFQLGADYRQTLFNPGADKNIGSGTGLPDNRSTVRFSDIYLQAEYARPKYTLRVAGRLNFFKNREYSTKDPEIRAAGTLRLSPGTGIEITYDYLVQYYHTLEGIPTGWSLDMIIPPDGQFRPEKAHQEYIGIFQQAGPLRLSAGVYYKQMHNLVYYRQATAFFDQSTSGWSGDIDSGKGVSYGLEVFVEKNGKRFQGKAAYTLSKSNRTFPRINHGETFPFKFDRRHIFNLNGTYILKNTARRGMGLTASVSCSSGHRESLLSFYYKGFMPGMGNWQYLYSHPEPSIGDYGIPPGWDKPLPEYDRLDGYISEREYYSHPNNYRLPAYFRADIGYYAVFIGKKATHKLNIGIYNLTNRHNAYSLFWDQEEAVWKKMSLFPIMPAVAYSIGF